MTLHSLPLFVKLAAKPVILVGEGEAVAPKRRLLERAGANIVGEEADAAFAIVALGDDAEAEATVARLRARGILVNAVDRPALCDFTLPALVERGPVLLAIGTGGISAGLAAALRQRLEALLPATLGRLTTELGAARAAMRRRFPDMSERRRAMSNAFTAGGALDLLGVQGEGAVAKWLASAGPQPASTSMITLASPDPDDLTLRQARLLAMADRLWCAPEVPAAIIDRARADAERLSARPISPQPGLTVVLEMAP